MKLKDLPLNKPTTVKVKVGRYLKPLTLTHLKGDKVKLKFGFNRPLIEEVKMMEGARWSPDDKCWTIKASQHNDFQFSYLQGKPVYAPYDAEIPVVITERPLREHQLDIVGHMKSRPGSISACEMGTGKSLSWIEATEQLIALGFCNPTPEDIWYVGPISGVRAVTRELKKWNATFEPLMLSYEKKVKLLKDWDGSNPPKILCYDESSKLKNMIAQRTQAAKHLTDSMREHYGTDCRIMLMTGTPSPKSPMNWWSQCMIAQPGFLKEGKENKFRERLAILQKQESPTGGVYHKILSWRDDENKCEKCGQYKDDPRHALVNAAEFDFCEYKPMKNEVAYLNERLKGLVLVKFKKDCTDLPEKQYEVIQLKPTIEMIRASKLIRKISTRAVTALILLRELSDGFQYTEEKIGTKECMNCNGTGKYETLIPKDTIDPMKPQQITEADFNREVIDCPACGATGQVDAFKKAEDHVHSPKDDFFISELDEHEDVGRYIVFAGFRATLTKLVNTAHQQGWATLRIDGGGYVATAADGTIQDTEDFLDAMDLSHPRYNELREKYPRICVIAHPKAGGMALTFTASPTTLYYSNDFDGEARMQSEDRFHRLGMDANRGATIKDLILLPSDRLVLNNLKTKKKLQNLTMGEVDDAFTSS